MTSRIDRREPLYSSSIPQTMSPVEFLHCFPNWKPAVDAACKSMASVHINSQHQGAAIFVGKGIVVAPLHLLLSSYSGPLQGKNLEHLIKNMRICFTQIDNDAKICYVPSYLGVHGIVEQHPEHDFCLISCESEYCQHPPISHSLPDKCLFAQINNKGELLLSIVQSCPSPFWEGGFCAYSPTKYGSCGGCYFDMSGALIAVHLATTTGLCGTDTGREKKGILAKDMIRCSKILADLQNVCLTSHLLTLHEIIHPPQSDDLCFEKEKAVVKNSLQNGNYSCYYSELRYGTQRSVKFILQFNKETMLSPQFQLRHVNGKYRLNIHDSGVYSNHEEEFYQSAANAILALFIQHTITPEFHFTYRKKDFVAIEEERN